MRTIRTVYRITRDGTEVYQGKRSAVLRKLSTLSRRGNLADYHVESGKYKPAVESGPDVWDAKLPAIAFIAIGHGKDAD